MENNLTKGQVWTFKTGELSPLSRLYILRVEEGVVHIAVEGVSDDGQSFVIGHLPISLQALQGSLTELESSQSKHELDMEGYNVWLEENGGVWDAPVSEIVIGLIT